MLCWCVFLINLSDNCFLLWYGSCPILQEENCWGSFSSFLHFYDLLYISFMLPLLLFVIVCRACPSLIVARPGGGDGFLFRPLRIPFLSWVTLESFCYGIGFGRLGAVKIFLTHYLVLSPGLLYVDTVVLGLLLCLYIHTCSVL